MTSTHARIGKRNSYSEKFEWELFEGYNLTNQRDTLDLILTPKGLELTRSMEELNMSVLNGRTNSDSPAQCTCLGTSGATVIDLVCVNHSAMEEITDLQVSNLSLESDHLPILITMKSAHIKPSTKKHAPQKKEPNIKWIREYHNSYLELPKKKKYPK